MITGFGDDEDIPDGTGSLYQKRGIVQREGFALLGWCKGG